MRKIKNINMQQVTFTHSWRRLPGYLQGKIKSIGQRQFVKTERTKNTQAEQFC